MYNNNPYGYMPGDYRNYNMYGHQGDSRIFGGFAAPFLLGGLAGAALMPAFYRPYPYYPPYPPYPPYPYFGPRYY
jgi:hypothetical protein